MVNEATDAAEDARRSARVASRSAAAAAAAVSALDKRSAGAGASAGGGYTAGLLPGHPVQRFEVSDTDSPSESESELSSEEAGEVKPPPSCPHFDAAFDVGRSAAIAGAPLRRARRGLRAGFEAGGVELRRATEPDVVYESAFDVGHAAALTGDLSIAARLRHGLRAGYEAGGVELRRVRSAGAGMHAPWVPYPRVPAPSSVNPPGPSFPRPGLFAPVAPTPPPRWVPAMEPGWAPPPGPSPAVEQVPGTPQPQPGYPTGLAGITGVSAPQGAVGPFHGQTPVVRPPQAAHYPPAAIPPGGALLTADDIKHAIEHGVALAIMLQGKGEDVSSGSESGSESGLEEPCLLRFAPHAAPDLRFRLAADRPSVAKAEEKDKGRGEGDGLGSGEEEDEAPEGEQVEHMLWGRGAEEEEEEEEEGEQGGRSGKRQPARVRLVSAMTPEGLAARVATGPATGTRGKATRGADGHEESSEEEEGSAEVAETVARRRQTLAKPQAAPVKWPTGARDGRGRASDEAAAERTPTTPPGTRSKKRAIPTPPTAVVGGGYDDGVGGRAKRRAARAVGQLPMSAL